jgi:prevent-host-death family protein
MLMAWRLADAKNRFSELVNRALTNGPQLVLRRCDAVVVVSRRDYEKLTGKRLSFKQFLLGMGASFRGLDLTRARSPMRNVKL